MKNVIAARKLPPLMEMLDGSPVKTRDGWRARRFELLQMLSREEYGFTPAAPKQIFPEIQSTEISCGGKALESRVTLSFETPNGLYSFPFVLIRPRTAEPVPAFVVINFRPDIPDKYIPVEEIIDRGYALAVVYYKDVTDDSAKMDGLAAMYPVDPQTGWGKIGMWAFACSRVMDYLETLPCIDATRVCVSGHSRLGKTALWCAAQDERFSMAVSNDSGCSGAAISRGKVGESIRDIADVRFPYWFCGNYRSWMDREWAAPFDQHMLLALIAPRHLYVCSATEDEWADPVSEFLCAAAVSEVWNLHRVPGLVNAESIFSSSWLAPEANVDVDIPVLDDLFGEPPLDPWDGVIFDPAFSRPTVAADKPLHDGCIAYHQRTGAHYFSRTDWNWHIDYRDKHHV